MGRGMLIGAVAAALAGAVRADDWPPRLVGSFPAPPDAIALACEYEPLYALVGGTHPTVFILDRSSGAPIGNFYVTVPDGARGIAATGSSPTSMWISNSVDGFLYRLTTTGSLLGSFRCPGGTPYGLGGYKYGGGPDAGYVSVSCRNENEILRINATTGSLASSFPGPATAVIGYDEMFAVDRYSDCLFWKPQVRFGYWEVLDTLPALPWSVTTTVYGTTDGAASVICYVLCGDGHIYRFEGVKGDAVAPASLGRVKALYR